MHISYCILYFSSSCIAIYVAECVTGELRDEPYALIADQVIEFADDFSDGPLEELSDCDAGISSST
jgi:hypothetical protein